MNSEINKKERIVKLFMKILYDIHRKKFFEDKKIERYYNISRKRNKEKWNNLYKELYKNLKAHFLEFAKIYFNNFSNYKDPIDLMRRILGAALALQFYIDNKDEYNELLNILIENDSEMKTISNVKKIVEYFSLVSNSKLRGVYLNF